MTPNRLTEQEKQMPEIKPPFRNLAVCLLCLFCLALTVAGFAAAGFPSILFLLTGAAALPSLAGVIAYFNQSIRFDKEGFVYRDALRKLHRHTYGEIRVIKEEQGKLYFILDENKIPVNKNHAHSRWLLELAEKKHGTEGERSYSSAEQKKDGIPLYRRNLSFSLFGIFVLIAFVICLFPAFVTLSTEKDLRMEKVIYPTSASLNDSYEVQAPKYKDTTKTLEVIIGTDEDYTYFLNVYGWEEERVNDLLALLATGEPLTVYGIGGTGGMTIYEAYDANGVQICAKEEEEARLALKQEERKAKFGLAVKILGGILLLHWFLWWNIHRIPLFLARLLIFCYDIPSRKFLETLPPKRERLRDLAYRRRVYAKDHFGLKDPAITETKIKPQKREPLPIPKEEELSPEVQAKVLRDIDKINKEADFLSNKYTVYLIFLIAICVFGVVAYLLKMLTVTP